MQPELGEIILERIFDAFDKEGNQKQIKLLIGKPQITSDDTDSWSCSHQIIGIGNEKIHVAYGEDAIAALMNGLQFAHVLLRLRYNHSHHITWLGQDDLHLPPLPDMDKQLENVEGADQFEEIFNEFFNNFRKER
jgi:hypothetical protein